MNRQQISTYDLIVNFQKKKGLECFRNISAHRLAVLLGFTGASKKFRTELDELIKNNKIATRNVVKTGRGIMYDLYIIGNDNKNLLEKPVEEIKLIQDEEMANTQSECVGDNAEAENNIETSSQISQYKIAETEEYENKELPDIYNMIGSEKETDAIELPTDLMNIDITTDIEKLMDVIGNIVEKFQALSQENTILKEKICALESNHVRLNNKAKDTLQKLKRLGINL